MLYELDMYIVISADPVHLLHAVMFPAWIRISHNITSEKGVSKYTLGNDNTLGPFFRLDMFRKVGF